MTSPDTCGLAAPTATPFLGAQDVLRLVRLVGLQAFLAGLAQRLEHDLRRWPQFTKQPRVASHSPDGVIELMPIADDDRFAFKYVNGHPGNPSRRLPTVLAFGLLADVATGLPRLLCELTLLTAVRTAAMSAVAARRLARPDSRVMALIGNGAQSEFQALAFHHLVGIRNLRLYDVDPAATDKLVRNLAGEAIELVRCDSAAQAVQGADIVTTVTADKRRAAVLLPEMVTPGQHINAVGGDCPGKTELHPGVLARADVFVEFEPQTRMEGDIQQMPADFPVTEIWRVLAGLHGGRRAADDITVFDSVGFALEDYSALVFTQELAARHGIGRALELVLAPSDPRDLFGLLRSAGTRAALPIRGQQDAGLGVGNALDESHALQHG